MYLYANIQYFICILYADLFLLIRTLLIYLLDSSNLGPKHNKYLKKNLYRLYIMSSSQLNFFPHL